MQKFDMKNPTDRAKLLPGYYWATNCSYYDRVIVSVYVWEGKGIVSTGNEYTENTLEELIENAEKYSNKYPIFLGPIEFPEEFKV